MEALFRFLAGYEILIYFVLGVGILITLRWLWRALRETLDAIYGLEKQIASRNLSSAIAAIALIILLVIGELYITSFLVPDLPSSTFLLTPTVNVLTTPGSAPESELALPLTATEIGIGPIPPVFSGCTPNMIMITEPSPGQDLSGVVKIYGIIDVKDLGFYKFEFASAERDNWATFFAGREIKPDEPIGAWDTSQLSAGEYQLRLVVTNNQGEEYPPCVGTFRVTGGQ
jgi:hypothetical protein